LAFEEYALDWWSWEKSEYVRGRNARSAAGNPAISQRYADEMARILSTRVLPAFKGKKLSAITPRAVEAWITDLRGHGLKNKDINRVTRLRRLKRPCSSSTD
jgi:hypothetical protein